MSAVLDAEEDFLRVAELVPRAYSLGLPRPLPRTGVCVRFRVTLGEDEAMVVGTVGDLVTPVKKRCSRSCRYQTERA